MLRIQPQFCCWILNQLVTHLSSPYAGRWLGTSLSIAGRGAKWLSKIGVILHCTMTMPGKDIQPKLNCKFMITISWKYPLPWCESLGSCSLFIVGWDGDTTNLYQIVRSSGWWVLEVDKMVLVFAIFPPNQNVGRVGILAVTSLSFPTSGKVAGSCNNISQRLLICL